MGKKKSGSFGGLFDFNGDGRTDAGELWLAYMVFEEIKREIKEEEELLSSDDDWQIFCEDGSEYGIYPCFYDNEFEYEEALYEAKYGWREECKEGLEYDVDPDDYETKEEYDAALYKARYGWRNICEDGSEYGLNPENYEKEEAYEDALETAKYGWREECDDNEYDIDPDDYETKEEYLEAVNEAKYSWRKACEDGTVYGIHAKDYETAREYVAALGAVKYAWRNDCEDGIEYGVDPEDFETKEEYERVLIPAKEAAIFEETGGIKRDDYPNERTYEAARALYELKKEKTRKTSKKKQALIELCDFILNSPSIIASHYLTCTREYLFVLAIKDHFPGIFKNVTEENYPELADAIEELAEKKPVVAAEAWLWCLETFCPYLHYCDYPNKVTSEVFQSVCWLSDAFRDAVIDGVLKKEHLIPIMINGNVNCLPAVEDIVSRCFYRGETALAVKYIEEFLTVKQTDTSIRSFIDELFFFCDNDEELESMEQYRDVFLPIVAKLDRPKLAKKIEQRRIEAEKCIAYHERFNERYAYSRRNAWRNKYRSTGPQNIDPCDYETEEEYLEEVRNCGCP